MAAALGALAVSAGALRASEPILGRGLSAVGNLAPSFRLVVAAPRSRSAENRRSAVCLLVRRSDSSRRFLSVQVNSQNQEMATAAIRSVPVQVARELLNAGHRYLDVRTAEEFASGHVEGAVNVPYLKNAGGGMTKNLHFVDDVSGLFHKDDEVVVGCLSGRRSLMAAAELQAAEFTNITDMMGGFKAWGDSGLPTVAKS